MRKRRRETVNRQRRSAVADAVQLVANTQGSTFHLAQVREILRVLGRADLLRMASRHERRTMRLARYALTAALDGCADTCPAHTVLRHGRYLVEVNQYQEIGRLIKAAARQERRVGYRLP